MGELVSLVLQLLDLPLELRKVRYAIESLLEETCGADECRSLLLEKVVEASLAWDE